MRSHLRSNCGINFTRSKVLRPCTGKYWEVVFPVNFTVLSEMVAPSKSLGAHLAGVGFYTRVRSAMSSELVRSAKTPTAARPGTREWFLTRVSSEVSFQVRRLRVHLCKKRSIRLIIFEEEDYQFSGLSFSFIVLLKVPLRILDTCKGSNDPPQRSPGFC